MPNLDIQVRLARSKPKKLVVCHTAQGSTSPLTNAELRMAFPNTVQGRKHSPFTQMYVQSHQGDLGGSEPIQDCLPRTEKNGVTFHMCIPVMWALSEGVLVYQWWYTKGMQSDIFCFKLAVILLWYIHIHTCVYIYIDIHTHVLRSFLGRRSCHSLFKKAPSNVIWSLQFLLE